MRFAELDAVTLDAFGTLVELVDPIPSLERLLTQRGLEHSRGEIGAAFAVEAAYYRRRAITGRNEEALAALRDECAAVFLRALGEAPLEDGFAARYVQALRFEVIRGVRSSLAELRARGLRLAVVSNWDISLHGHLAELDLVHFFDAVVCSADVGIEKPDPRIFARALERLGARPERTIHVGDGRSDAEGARAAGITFAPAPLGDVVAAWR
jgi:putative hydrolase of the HAD superfamily